MKRVKLLPVFYVFLATLIFSSCEEILNKADEKLENREITENITEDVTWESGKTYIIDGTIRVGGSETVTITIEPGAIIKFNEEALLDIAYWDNEYARIIAKGTEDDPIIFTSNKPSPSAGDWESIAFYEGALDCEFEYCEFMYGGYNDYYGNVYIENSEVSFKHCTFANSSTHGVVLSSGGRFSSFSDNTFSEISSYAISIFPEFISTIGSNNSYDPSDKIYVEAGNEIDVAGEYVWKNQVVPYVFDGGMRVGSSNTQGVNITIEAGTTINFTTDSYIDFGYWDDTYVTLTVNGTEENPIRFTSNSPNPSAGDWNSLNFYDGAVNCQLNYSIIEYGGSSEYYGNAYIEHTAVGFSNCTFNNSESIGIHLFNEGEFSTFEGNSFSNHAMYPVSIYPNAVKSMGTGNIYESGSAIYVDADQELTKGGLHEWLNQGVPFIIDGTMRLGNVNGAHLNIAAGVVLKFTSGSAIDVAYWSDQSGSLSTNGTLDQPVIFTSNNPYPAKGDWGGLYFYEGVSGSVLKYCLIEYAGNTDSFGALSLDYSGVNTVKIEHSIISNSASHAITVDDNSSLDYSTVTFLNNNGDDYYIR